MLGDMMGVVLLCDKQERACVARQSSTPPRHPYYYVTFISKNVPYVESGILHAYSIDRYRQGSNIIFHMVNLEPYIGGSWQPSRFKKATQLTARSS